MRGGRRGISCGGRLISPAAVQRQPAIPKLGQARLVNHFGFAPVFLQSDRNFLRSLPCRPFASASLEHSSDASVRTTGGLAAILVDADAGGVGVGVAGDCASAEPASKIEAKTLATKRDGK